MGLMVQTPNLVGTTLSKSDRLYKATIIKVGRHTYTAIQTKQLLPSTETSLDEWQRIMKCKDIEFEHLNFLIDAYLKLAKQGNYYTKEEICQHVFGSTFHSSLTLLFPGQCINAETGLLIQELLKDMRPCIGVLLLSLGPTNLYAGHLSFNVTGMRYIIKDIHYLFAKIVFKNSKCVGISVNISPEQKGMNRLLIAAGFELMNQTNDTNEYFILCRDHVGAILQNKIQMIFLEHVFKHKALKESSGKITQLQTQINFDAPII